MYFITVVKAAFLALLAVLHGVADMSTVRTVVCTDSKGARREADELFAL